jgi:hypothetical protein
MLLYSYVSNIHIPIVDNFVYNYLPTNNPQTNPYGSKSTKYVVIAEAHNNRRQALYARIVNQKTMFLYQHVFCTD